jgi:transcriptional regulator with XRE-family HTH domain
MITRKEILSSEAYWLEKIQNDLFHQVQLYLKKNKKKQNDLAASLGVSKSYISQIINGSFDHKLSKFVELSLAIGLVPEIQFKTISTVLEEDEEAFVQKSDYFNQYDSIEAYEKLSTIVGDSSFVEEEIPAKSSKATASLSDEYSLSA